MNTSQHKDTAQRAGSASIDLYTVNLAGDLTRLIQTVQHEAYGSCSDCLKGWVRLNNGLEEVATSLLVMILTHARHSDTTTGTAGTSLHPTFQRIVDSW